MKKHNFYAGPSILSQYAIRNTADAVINFADMGLSLLEISHRSKQFQAVVDEAVALFKELLEIPEGYSVLFLGGDKIRVRLEKDEVLDLSQPNELPQDIETLILTIRGKYSYLYTE